jgi:hypothetical protein
MRIVAKLFNKLLADRLRAGLDNNLRYSQNGFRAVRSTSQHVLSARRIIEEIQDSELGKLVAIFIDLVRLSTL